MDTGAPPFTDLAASGAGIKAAAERGGATGTSGAYTGASKGLKSPLSATGAAAAGGWMTWDSLPVAAGACDEASKLRVNTNSRTSRFTASNSASAMAHAGSRERGLATPESTSPGTLWRCRSSSDFLNDMKVS